MPRSVPLVSIATDPQAWPSRIRTHIEQRLQERKAPSEFWAALKRWSWEAPHAGLHEDWWKDLGPYNPKLQGWRLVGNGTMPSTVLGPNEPRNVGRKVADWLDSYVEWHL